VGPTHDHLTEEIKRLRRCMNDLVGVVGLAAVWTGRAPSQIVGILLDSLLGMLLLDVAYARVEGPDSKTAIEMVRVAQSRQPPTRASDIGDALANAFGGDPLRWPPSARIRLAGSDVSVATVRLGLRGDAGVVVAGTQRADFPDPIDTLLLRVAASQAAIGLQEARLLGEQRRLAHELDQRVAQRTTALAAANTELKREVTVRRRAEAALRASEHDARLIVDSIPAGVALLTPTGEVDDVNRQVLQYFGRPLDELKNWVASDIVHPEDVPNVVRRLTHSINSGEPYECEHRLRRHDGRYRWFQARGLPLRNADGGIVRWYILLTDIDERKRAQEALQRGEAFLAEAQRLSSTGSFSWRVSTDDITWSDELHRIFELDPPLTPARIRTRVHPEDVHAFDTTVDRARHTGDDFECRCRLLMPNHSIKHLHVVAHATRDREGQLEYIAAVQDVTESRVSEEALRDAQQQLARAARVTSLGVLTASIAHEINQPLSGIVTNAGTCLRMLAADPPDVDGARETARRTIRDGNRASEVVTRLRALFGRSGSTTEPVDLNDAAQEVIMLSSSELQRNRVVVRTELAAELPPVFGDRVQLQEVILNLCLNALDAMRSVDDRPRQLVVRTERDEGTGVRLTVQDAGVGLDPHAADALFQPFYTTKTGGMGIGLSVSRSIIENHRGRIWAASNDGPGASFSFSVPCAPQAVSRLGGPRIVHEREVTPRAAADAVHGGVSP